MNTSKVVLFSATALFIGTVSYFVIEGISLCKKNKKAKSIKTSINNLNDTKVLVEGDSESQEIVDESLKDELKKDEEISRKIENSKNRIGIAIIATIKLAPSVLKFLASLALSSSKEKENGTMYHYAS
jgi:tRNA threonylcarbamoyladenosine modification (KEOPS) complex  Pcc1 subunit